MHIVFYTVFHPAVGGMESIAELLASEWFKQGVRVTIATRVPDVDTGSEGRGKSFPFAVVREPSVKELFELVSDCDVYMLNGLSLRGLLPWVLLRRPLAVRHGIWYSPSSMRGGDPWAPVKRLACRFPLNIFASKAVATSHRSTGIVIGNPYDDAVFHTNELLDRDRDLVFLGRLVSDKGVDLLFEAVSELARRDLSVSVTVIGGGPERSSLQQLAKTLGIVEQVIFLGSLSSTDVAPILRRHRIMVVPSRWEEPFGIVALEGAACGCVLVGSDGGGLPEAIGPSGVLFRRGDVEDLTDKLEMLVRAPSRQESFRLAARSYLEGRRAKVVASEYLSVLELLASGKSVKSIVRSVVSGSRRLK